MKWNKQSPREKPPTEMPECCGSCAQYDARGGGYGICSADGAKSFTLAICDPSDRPLPLPLNCCWWYAARVWTKISKGKRLSYAEERIHVFVMNELLPTQSRGDQNELIAHCNRWGGGGIIDFSLYPEAKSIYERIWNEEMSGRYDPGRKRTV